MSPKLAERTLLPHQKIIFALDFQSFEAARPAIERLKDKVGLFKIGWTLLLSEGLNILEKIEKTRGVSGKFFLDLKYSGRSVEDIPQQTGGIASVIRSKTKRVDFITVHTYEGEASVKEAIQKLKTAETRILGVTVLTSIDRESANAPFGSNLAPREMVLKRAETAKNAGCDGVVCSGLEARAVKERFGSDFIVVTPGIRPAWSAIDGDDQKRIVTPGEAIKNGADYIVVGRPISTAKDPAEAAERIAEEIAAALRSSSLSSDE